jgi:nicotinamide-nucleotide amidase
MKKSFWTFLALLLIAAPTLGATAPAARSTPLDYVIVVTGGELLEGAYPDGHTHFITRTLRPLGCRCVGSLIVDDQKEDLLRALAFATNRAPLVLVTGGLGPTPNDITREAISAFTGLALQEQPEVLADMERRFGQSRDQLRPNLRRQTRVPQPGDYLKNPHGTAVGLVFDLGQRVVVALPGPPRELQPMVKGELAPYLGRRFGVRPFGDLLTLRFVGVGQSLIDQTIQDHVPIAADVVITSFFEGGRVDFTFSLPGNTAEDHARLKRLERDLLVHLGDYFYADDGSTLEESIVQTLAARGWGLALVEAGSGGHLAASLSGARGAGALLRGACTAPSEERLAGLLQVPPQTFSEWKEGAERTKALAVSAQKRTGAKSVLAVGEVQSEPANAPGVWVALGLGEGKLETQWFAFRDTGESARAALCTQILDRMRRLLKASAPAAPAP